MLLTFEVLDKNKGELIEEAWLGNLFVRKHTDINNGGKRVCFSLAARKHKECVGENEFESMMRIARILDKDSNKSELTSITNAQRIERNRGTGAFWFASEAEFSKTIEEFLQDKEK